MAKRNTSPQARVEDDIMKAALKRTAEEQVIEGPERPREVPKPQVKKRPASFPKKAMLTYIPLEDGDHAFTTWYGVKFRANVAREVTNRDMIESAMTNPWFSVDGKPPFKRAAPRKGRDTSEDARSMALAEGAKEVELEELTDGDEDAS